MPTVQFAFANLLEQSGITITVTDAATGNPKEHLYDRDLVFPWKAADASGDKEIKVDQGGLGVRHFITSWRAQFLLLLGCFQINFQSRHFQEQVGGIHLREDLPCFYPPALFKESLGYTPAKIGAHLQ